MELAWNQNRNWLTLMAASRVMSFQLLTCAAQNVAGGDVLVNRGPFALYRGQLVRDVLPAYLGETFMGRPVRLGDDAALTLFARGRGRAVQQPTAFCYAVYPQTIGHHFRQWTRWMRGSTIRNCWRLRYLPFTSWGWWYTVLNTWTFFAGLGIPVAVLAAWPQSEMFAVTSGAAAAIWACATSLRTLTVHRSDQGWLGRWALIAMAPAAVFWVLLVLRPVRLYGILTCLRQGWVTRHQVEVTEDLAPARVTA
jgi:hyaluronan synthase